MSMLTGFSNNLIFQVFDIINDDNRDLGIFGIVHDKGTYDAICLNPNVKEYRQKYIQKVVDILDDNGRLYFTKSMFIDLLF